MQNPTLNVVLPVLNEKDVVEKVICEIDAYSSRLAGDVEIIAVNDGSMDGTKESGY